MRIEPQHLIVSKKILQNILISAILIFSVLLVLQQANPARSKLGRDSGAYIYIGSQILRGAPPYLTAWDSKPPGIFLLDAAGLWLGKGTRWGIWLIEVISLTATAIFGFLAMREHFGIAVSLIASMIWLYALNRLLIGGNLTEEYSLFWGFLSSLLFILSLKKEYNLWLYVGIGLCAGGSFLLRPNNTGVQISIILTLIVLTLLRKQYLALVKRLIIIGAAALFPLGIVAIYLISKNALQASWEAAIIYNFFSYAGVHHFNLSGSLLTGIFHIGFISHFAFLGLLIALSELWPHIKEYSPHSAIVLWISINGLLEIALSALSGRNYEHYFINWLPFIAFSNALLITRVLPQFINWIQPKTLAILIVVTVLISASFNGVISTNLKSMFNPSSAAQYTDQVANYVRLHTTSDETVLVWGGQAGINFLSQRDSPVSYLFFPLGVPSSITNHLSEDYYQAIKTNPPKYIVDGNIYDFGHVIPLSTSEPVAWLSKNEIYKIPYLLETLKFIHDNYTLVQSIEGIDIYRLNR